MEKPNEWSIWSLKVTTDDLFSFALPWITDFAEPADPQVARIASPERDRWDGRLEDGAAAVRQTLGAGVVGDLVEHEEGELGRLPGVTEVDLLVQGWVVPGQARCIEDLKESALLNKTYHSRFCCCFLAS